MVCLPDRPSKASAQHHPSDVLARRSREPTVVEHTYLLMGLGYGSMLGSLACLLFGMNLKVFLREDHSDACQHGWRTLLIACMRAYMSLESSRLIHVSSWNDFQSVNA